MPHHLYLVSDSTGETVSSVARAALAQFDEAAIEEHSWSLVRTKGQMEKIVQEIEEKGGFVLYTIANNELRRYLKKNCDKMGVPCISVLSRIVSDLSSYFGIEASHKVGTQYAMDEAYFSRVEAINFALAHDDGKAAWDLEESDVVVVGVSRTSKSPTCMYLAYRGYRAANVPFVPDVVMPEELEQLTEPLVVGLTISPEMLMQIRKNRILSLKQEEQTVYTDFDQIKEELLQARRLFARNNWPVIDVTRRSIEETAATIVQHILDRKK